MSSADPGVRVCVEVLETRVAPPIPSPPLESVVSLRRATWPLAAPVAWKRPWRSPGQGTHANCRALRWELRFRQAPPASLRQLRSVVRSEFQTKVFRPATIPLRAETQTNLRAETRCPRHCRPSPIRAQPETIA